MNLRERVSKSFEKIPACHTIPRDVKSKDLYLIQVPASFDVELLNGASVKLTGDKALELTKETGGEDFSYRTSVESIEPQVLPVMLVPDQQNYTTGCTIANQIQIYKSFDVPLPTVPDCSQVNIVQPEGLRERWRPFGCDEPPLLAKKRKTSSTPKKKKKRKH